MNIEYELDPVTMSLTGRWRRRQYYAEPGYDPIGGKKPDRRPPSARKPCEWREPKR